MDLNLETLKNEILTYLESSDFAVFRSQSGALKGLPIIPWDSERWPNYRGFLEVARKVGQKLILFASRELAEEEIEEALEELDEAGFAREERREVETRIRNAKRHTGSTCAIELGFDHNAHFYVYEARPDWYDEFLDACDEITSALSISEDDGTDNLGGYYSRN